MALRVVLTCVTVRSVLCATILLLCGTAAFSDDFRCLAQSVDIRDFEEIDRFLAAIKDAVESRQVTAFVSDAVHSDDVSTRLLAAKTLRWVDDEDTFRKCWDVLARDGDEAVRASALVAGLLNPFADDGVVKAALADENAIARSAGVLASTDLDLIQSFCRDGSPIVRSVAIRRLGMVLGWPPKDLSGNVKVVISALMADADQLCRSNSLLTARYVGFGGKNGVLQGVMLDPRCLLPLEFVCVSDGNEHHQKLYLGSENNIYLATRFLIVQLSKTTASLSLIPPPEFYPTIALDECRRIGAFALALGVYIDDDDAQRLMTWAAEMDNIDEQLKVQLEDIKKQVHDRRKERSSN